MNKLLLLQYNSYFDRTIKKKNSVTEYLVQSERSCFIGGVDFKLADGLSTTVFANMAAGEFFYPDYVIVTDENKNIISRWFVIESFFQRGKQLRLSLKRDTVADFSDKIKIAPCLVERGPLGPGSPLILNSEGFSFNQIKKSEILLKDPTETPWIIGYLSRDTDDDSYITADNKSNVNYPNIKSSDYGLVFNDPADLSKGAVLEVLEGAAPEATVDAPLSKYLFSSDLFSGQSWYQYTSWKTEYSLGAYSDYEPNKNAASIRYGFAVQGKRLTAISYIEEAFSLEPSSKADALLGLNGSIVYDSDSGKYYRLSIGSNTTSKSLNAVTDEHQNLYQLLRSFCQAVADGSNGQFWMINPSYYDVSITKRTISVFLEEVSGDGQVRTKLPTTRNKLVDAPFDMFAMPLSLRNLSLALSMITQKTAENKTKKIYDVQILPFCPFLDAQQNIESMTQGYDYEDIEEFSDGTWSATGDHILFPMTSSGSLFIEHRIDMDPPIDKSTVSTPQLMKISNETELIRLCGPNYASAYEFSLAKNGGYVSGFRVDYTYRPYSPYVRVCPKYQGAYGSFDNDARGLILSGDFSVDMVSDAWTEYVNQNKNYEAIFNTQIKTMDAQHDIDRAAKLSGVGIGSIAAGAAAGAATGNAFVGIGAAIVSAGAGMVDFAMNDARFDANRKQAIETFKYQLGNIKALPNTLTKVTAYNVNNKYFPIVEVYEATEEEVSYLKKYIDQYNFRIGVVSTMQDIVKNGSRDYEYFKAKIVRFEPGHSLHDNVMEKDAYNELDQGLWIYKEVL